VIKSIRTRWAQLVAYMEEKRVAYKVFMGNTQGNSLLGTLAVDGSITLKNLKGIEWKYVRYE
jgi:hypothetical protein